MLKNKLCFIFLIICFTFLMISCVHSDIKEKSIKDIAEYSNITSIEFIDGRGGLNKSFKLKDNEKIRVFSSYIDKYIVTEETKHTDSVGWIHKANFYSYDKKILSITFGDPLEINGMYYNVLKGNLNSKQIDEFIKSVNSSWNIP